MKLARHFILLPLLVLDCLGNITLCRGSWRNTMSASAWANRNHKYFSWCCKFVDAIFGAGHCQEQYEREQKYGSVWAAWRASIREQ
jgi:hypothetical protein